MQKIVIIGGGSFLGNLINYIEGMNQFEIVGYTDIDNHGIFGDVTYLGNDAILSKLYETGISKAAVAIGNNLNDTMVKQKAIKYAKKIGYEFPVIKGENIVIHRGVTIGEGTILRDGCIIQSNSKIGNFSMIGDRAVISHDAIIGNYSQIVTGCVVGRGVTIGSSVFLGFSAVINNDLRIVDGCTIGALSFVNKDCLVKGLYFGQPAILKKEYEK